MPVFFHQTSRFVLKNLAILLICLGIPASSIAQEFEWVYTIPSVMGTNDGSRSSSIRSIITNSNHEIYAFGSHTGTHDFGNQTYTTVTGGNYGTSIVKLDENKNVLWVRKIPSALYLLSNPEGIKLALDADENLLIGGIFQTTTTSISFDPDYHVAFNPVNVYENLPLFNYYGVVLKLDGQDGHYIDDILFENIVIEDITVDSNNDIVVVGATTEFHFTHHKWLRAYIAKLDNNLTFVWDKTYTNNDNLNAFFAVGLDSQNNIYCQGTFLNGFTFGNTTLQNSSSEFICKLSPDGNEEWINELSSSPFIHHPDSAPIIFNRKICTDTSDNLYFFSSYSEAPAYQFNNTTISNLPLTDSSFPLTNESVFFKMDVNGNHIWNIPLYGSGDQDIIDFDINNLGELITVIDSNVQNLHYADNTVLESNGEISFLLKTNPQGQLVDFKRLDVNPYAIEIDTDNNILLGGRFKEIADFDPHPFNEYMEYTYTHFINNNSFYESVAFLLKLKNCDVEPLFLDTYDFCLVNNPNPTIGDIQPNDFNISWYSSESSQIPLDNDFPITDGVTYYMEKIADNCPTLMRQPVLMSVLPAPDPPIIEAVQPCFYENMRLSDLYIYGENTTFYDAPTEGNSISDTTIINPNSTYYVSQTINDCESQRIPISISDLGSNPAHSATICENQQSVNLSDYNQLFIPQNHSEFDYTFSYHLSVDQAFENENPIQNFQNYPVSEQTFFLRVQSQEHSCFYTGELTLQFSEPLVVEEIKVSDWTDNNSITILPHNEDYLYSIDGVNFQHQNHFSNLQVGQYTVYVKNMGDCEEYSDMVYLLDYPRFFTPNSDGFNDKWRIRLSQFQFLVDVEIYDRYGKLLTFFDKDSTGWDGTLNGTQLPATDYWFKIIRISDRKTIYRGHFALIR